MSIKNILLSSILLCGSILPVQKKKIEDYFFCDVPALRALEEQKLEAFFKKSSVNKNNLSEQEAQEVEMQAQILLARLLSLLLNYADLLVKYDDNDENGLDIKVLKSFSVEFSNRVQQDPELTNLVKNLSGFGCKHLLLILDTLVSSPDFAKITSGNMSEAEFIAMFAEYISKNMDVVQIVMEYALWNNAYLKKQLDAKKSLTIDDLCYTVQQFGVIAKFPKKSQELWSDLILAVQKGMKDLPQDLYREMLKKTETSLRKPELEIGMKLLESIAKLRREILTTRGSDQNKLIGYGKLLDQVFAQAQKIQQQATSPKNQILKLIKTTEKLIFKN